VGYVLTQAFDVFAETRESLLLQIMKYVEDSPASLAKPVQAQLVVSEGAATAKQKKEAPAKPPDPQNPRPT